MNKFTKKLYQNISSEWKLKQINDVVKKQVDRNNLLSDIYVGIENIESGSGTLLSFEDQKKYSTKQLFHKNDLLYSRIRPYLNKVWLSNSEGFCSTDIIVIKSLNIISNFLKYLMLSPEFVNFSVRHSAGTKMPRVNWEDIKKLLIPVPLLVEQRGIVEVLGTVDECIRLTDAVMERAEELKWGLMQQLLTRGIGHTEYKETPLGKIPKTWKINSIFDLCNMIVDCVNRTAPTVPFETEYKMIRTSNIRNGKLNLLNVKYVTKEIYKKWTRRGSPKKNDVILTREAPMGEVGIIQDEKKVFLGQRIVMYRCNLERLDPFYLLYTLHSSPIQTQIHKVGSGSTVEHMRVPDSKKLKIITPPIGEQKKIVEILKNLDNQIDIVQSKKNKLKLVKQGLMQLLLSGNIRVELRDDGLHRIGDG